MFIPNGGSWPYPYSGPALAGTVWLWAAVELALGSRGFRRSLLAGLVAGLAAGLKVEFLPAALLAPPLGLWRLRGRREALAAVAVALVTASVAWAGPIVLFGHARMAGQGILLAGQVPEPFLRLYRGLFWNDLEGLGGLLSRPGLGGYLPSTVFLGLAFAVITVLSRRRMTFAWRCAAGMLLFAYGTGGLYLGNSREIQALIPLAALLALWTAAALLRFRSREKWSAGQWAFICVGITLLPALARQPFSLSVDAPYSAFSAPLAIAFAPLWLAGKTGGKELVAAFLFGLGAAQAVERVEEFHSSPRKVVRFPRGSLSLHKSEARLVKGLVRAIERETAEDSLVAAFPDGGMVLFLAARRSPFRHELFHPGAQSRRDELEMIETLEMDLPAAAFVVNRTYPEFGKEGFGQGYLEDFTKVFHERMVEVGRVGKPSSRRRQGVKANAAILYLPVEEP